MNTSPLSPLPVPVQLVNEVLTITYDKRAEYRMGTLPRPLPVNMFNDNDKSFACLCAWIWCSMPTKHEKTYQSPEEIALAMPEESVQPNFQQFYKSFKAVQPPVVKEDPLTSGSPTGPSQSSS